MVIRSSPTPKAKPLYTDESTPPISNTLGCTIPQPRTSIQPLPLPDPAALAAAREAGAVHLRAGLRKREVMGTETNLKILVIVQLSQEGNHGSLQVGHRNALIDNQSFDLMEYRRMRSVHFITAVYTSRRDYLDRRLHPLHGTDLHRRRLRSQQQLSGAL